MKWREMRRTYKYDGGSRTSEAYVAENPEEAKMRKAECSCGTVSISVPSLPFFQARPDKEMDKYYCGCYGWN
jgi:hypothetical protein